MSQSKLEEDFAVLWLEHGNGYEPTREHRFHPKRKWRFDFAWLPERVAVEMEGGAYRGGRHQSMTGFQSDCEKYRHAALMRWRVLRYTRDDLIARPGDVVREITAALLDLPWPPETG